MSSVTSPSKRFVIASDGSIINVDYVVRVYADGTGQVFADMETGPDIQLQINAAQLGDLRRMLALNATPG